MLRASLAALALATTAIAAPGCGGSGKPTTASRSGTASTPSSGPSSTSAQAQTGSALSESQWRSQGDAICAHANAQLASIPVNRHRSFAVALPIGAAYERAEAAEMAKIVPPPAKAADWDTIVTGTRQSAENTAKLAQQAKAGRFAMTTPLAQETAKIRSTVMQVAKKDGFQYCSAFPA